MYESKKERWIDFTKISALEWPTKKQAQARDLSQTKPRPATSVEVGLRQGHPQEQAQAKDLLQSRSKWATSMEPGPSQQLPPEQNQTSELS